ncbi:MAG: hypothetical protein IKX56_09215, partial [Muribaculaceae bacterium]|nr:hypothetical protein [Muribaculaceae bacterium]
ARYRCYVTATSDSDINRALAWFSAHPSDREKLTRAYIYKGAVMDELGHPDSAMHYYKTAEATAAPTDYFNLGYSNMRIGTLYQDIFLNDSAVVSRMRNAANFFTAARDTNYLIITIGTIGLFDNIVGKDSAIHYLEKAIKLGKDANSSQQYYFQSKLAGIYFYEKEYQRSKDLALDIIANGKEDCKENKFYYYAARSYIKLNLLDSALWVKSLIPDPLDAVDSMNHHLLLSELAQATNDYRGYAHHSHQAHMIDERITESSLESTLPVTELHFDALQRENKLIKDKHLYTILLVVGCILLALAILLCASLVYRRMNRNYQKRLENVQADLKALIEETEQKNLAITSEREEHRRLLEQKNRELDIVKRKNTELESMQNDISERVSTIVQCRNKALKELYQGLRVKSDVNGSKRIMPLVGLIKDFHEKKKILYATPKESFWSNLKLSVDGEFNGIASFVEKNYPELTIKDQQLFMLMCAGLSNQIIRICMDYSSDVTVSNNKKRLVKKMGLDMKFDEFVQSFSERKKP